MAYKEKEIRAFQDGLKEILDRGSAFLELLPHNDMVEKLIGLELAGKPSGLASDMSVYLEELSAVLAGFATDDLRVVVFGGGTGMSNIIGGDSRSPGWPQAPFGGLKDVFKETRAITCVTDDGGSTGELLKDLPLIGLGDIRHVLLSSIQKRKLAELYSLDEAEALRIAAVLYTLFNYRFTEQPASSESLLQGAGVDLAALPGEMREYLAGLVTALFNDCRLSPLLARAHCLGNLLVAAAVYLAAEAPALEVGESAVLQGLDLLARRLGAGSGAVMPCTTTQTSLQVLYGNGVLVTGEYKSGHARRGYPVDRVFTRFADSPQVPEQVLETIRQADIIVFAPGSLYTSIIPVLQVTDLAEAVRKNSRALKVLIANLWVQKGETDVVWDDPGRRFYVSDLLMAYHRNIPGGVRGLFTRVMALGLRDIPGSILQSYATEEKVPIYLDRERVQRMGFMPVEAGIFSQKAIKERRVIQHDPKALARAIRVLWLCRHGLNSEPEQRNGAELLPGLEMHPPLVQANRILPSQRFAAITDYLANFTITCTSPTEDLAADDLKKSLLRDQLAEIIWRHRDIPAGHLGNVKGITLVDLAEWSRSQKWDKVFSFYDPGDGFIKIRQDVYGQPLRFEVAFLVALGQALLGNYAADKKMETIDRHGEIIGKVFLLTLRPPTEHNSFLNQAELDQYLGLSRMVRSPGNDLLYTRVVNGREGFTPPGLLFGLFYAWYLDNRFASHIEYKMSVMRNEVSDLIPEQVKMFARRKSLIDFFRKVVFQHDSLTYEEIVGGNSSKNPAV